MHVQRCHLIFLAVTLPFWLGFRGSGENESEVPSGGADSSLLLDRIVKLERENAEMKELLESLRAQLESLTGAREAAPALEKTSTIPSGAVPSRSNSAPVSATNRRRMSPSPASSQQEQPALWSELVANRSRVRLYGFFRSDIDVDSQRPNNGQIPFFVTSPEGSGNDRGNFSLHPRLTRFGADFAAPVVEELGGAELRGKLETDFENGGSESRQIIRIRHAFLQLKWDDFSLLAGQTWDTFSPLFPTVNHDSLMWNAGNVGDRRPQLRASFEPDWNGHQVSLTGGIGLTGAISPQDLDRNGFRDGEESSRPDLQARIGYTSRPWQGERASLGISGFYGWMDTSSPVADRTDFRIQAVNVDYQFPLAPRLLIRGEGWWGRNLADVRGGAGQGVRLLDGREIRSRGGWVELGLRAFSNWTIHPGFTTDDPLDEDIAAGGITRNQAFYLGNRIRAGANLLIGADYLRWKTSFKGLRRGLDDRFNIFFQYAF